MQIQTSLRLSLTALSAALCLVLTACSTIEDGGKIDHIEVFGPPADSALADSRNFVLCPGGEYDRVFLGDAHIEKLIG